MAESSNQQSVDKATSTGSPERLPARNTAFSIHFVIRGAEKRRGLAYSKAKTLQRELGVIPRLICIK